MSHTEFGGAVMMESKPEELTKENTKNVRLAKDLVGKLNYIVSVVGGSQAEILDPLVRKVILKKFEELTAASDPKRK
jgi:ABC-type ATPase with predicted acetyltransferase domain